MNISRSTVLKGVSVIGVCIAIMLASISLGLFVTYNFLHGQVSSQLERQRIFFPTLDSPEMNALPSGDKDLVSQYAGQQLVDGLQAEVFADHYIAVHVSRIGDGKTYSELSAQAMKDPSNAELVAKVDTIFRGETLRGMLLNAYAFDSMAYVANVAGYVVGITALVIGMASSIGFARLRKN